MKTLVTCIFVSAGLLASAGNALASEALAKKHNCLTCHAADKKVIGPSYSDAAECGGAGRGHQSSGEMGAGHQEVDARAAQ